ncbi:MAG: acylphosphatase [Candidatus Sabulitectum sp.]|nr:acylphosphatase [Candidatus Sabulitectum sp.]
MSIADDYIRVCIRVTGRVQGVGFRFWTMKHARRLGLAGTVSNMADYSVEAVFYGTVVAVEEMIRLCNKGPEGACVTGLTVLSRESIAICPEEFRIQH